MPAFELGFVERGDGEPVHDTGIAFSGEELELELRGSGANRAMPKVVRAVNAHDALVEALRAALADIKHGGHESVPMIRDALALAEAREAR